MTLLQNPDPANCIPEGFLASTSDLISLLSDWAGPAKLQSAPRRRDERPVGAALSSLLRDIQPISQLAPEARAVPVAAPARNTARISRRMRVETRDGRSLPKRREYCNCGQCKRCLDNARWTRIFNDKFADPTYYSGIVVRHNSTLAEAR
jgi:hypothetical protein